MYCTSGCITAKAGSASTRIALIGARTHTHTHGVECSWVAAERKLPVLLGLLAQKGLGQVLTAPLQELYDLALLLYHACGPVGAPGP